MNDFLTLGYVVLERHIPEILIDKVNDRLSELKPVRALSTDKKYAEKEKIQSELKDIAIWWSQMVMDWDEVIEIEKLISSVVLPHMQNGKWYASDIVTIESQSNFVNPHVDTPHRFSKWTEDKRLLGIQCIVSLHDIDKNSASTGLVPESQHRDFYNDMCNSGYYDKWFQKRAIQPDMPKGSLLFYNCRVLHSSMPNPSNRPRHALLFNYLESDIISEVENVDNIWNSNG